MNVGADWFVESVLHVCRAQRLSLTILGISHSLEAEHRNQKTDEHKQKDRETYEKCPRSVTHEVPIGNVILLVPAANETTTRLWAFILRDLEKYAYDRHNKAQCDNDT